MATAQKEIEMILTRQLASYLAFPVFVVDPEGSLVYYNEPAEHILGRRFEETDELPAQAWGTLFNPTDDAGAPLPVEALPLLIALHEQRPTQRSFWIRGLDEVARHIDVVAFPLLGQNNRFVGAVALFWEVKHP